MVSYHWQKAIFMCNKSIENTKFFCHHVGYFKLGELTTLPQIPKLVVMGKPIRHSPPSSTPLGVSISPLRSPTSRCLFLIQWERFWLCPIKERCHRVKRREQSCGHATEDDDDDEMIRAVTWRTGRGPIHMLLGSSWLTLSYTMLLRITCAS